MKKYLMTGIAAVAMCAAFTSCSKDTEFEQVTQEQLDEQKAQQITNAYNQAFIKTFGQPASNQTWGFGATRGITRSNGVGEVIKPDNGKDGIFIFSNEERNDPNWRSPQGVAKYVAPITQGEKEWVQAWFDNPENAGLSDEGEEFESFYVQQVNNRLCSDANDNKVGYFWENINGQIVKTEKNYKVKMDQLRIGSARSESNTVHINDYNATNGFNVWNAIYVKDGSSKQFGYYASYGSQWQWKFRCVRLTVPGDKFEDGQPRTGYYVGLSYYCDKVEVANQKGEIIGEDEIDICNDWILKIVPGNVVPKYDGRIMAEDLCATEGSDFDFNDVVFDWKIIEDGAKAKINLLAAGGTLPLRIGGKQNDENTGVEVHNKFKVNTDIMVNTATDGAPKIVEKPAVEFEILASHAGLNAFAADGSNIPIYVKKDGVWVELYAYAGTPAAKINCPISTKWVDEYAKITWAYPNFDNYVQQPSIKWWETVEQRFVNLILADNNPHPAN